MNITKSVLVNVALCTGVWFASHAVGWEPTAGQWIAAFVTMELIDAVYRDRALRKVNECIADLRVQIERDEAARIELLARLERQEAHRFWVGGR